MLKKVLTIVLPILLPFLLYFAYAALAKRGAGASGRVPSLSDSPWPWLGVSGVALMAAVLISYRFVFSDPGGPGATVIPDRYIDGEIQQYQIIEGEDIDAANGP